MGADFAQTFDRYFLILVKVRHETVNNYPKGKPDRLYRLVFGKKIITLVTSKVA